MTPLPHSLPADLPARHRAPPVEAGLPPAPGLLLLRPDLLIRPDGPVTERRWILGDSLRGEYYRLSETELELLRACDGKRTIGDILETYRDRHPDRELPCEELVDFFVRGVRLGLLIRGSGTEPVHDPRPPSLWWTNPLALRLPGIDPSPLLDWLEPRTRWLFSPVVAGLGMLVGCAGLVTVMGHYDRLSSELRHMGSWFTRETVWLTLICVALVKILHELAHALCCRHYGGKCRELGVLLLLFMPALYCDVTAAWGFPNRWHRILVSLAGVIAESALAAIAALLWSLSAPGPLRITTLVILVTCTISTWLVNLNPLLTYDGYYVLSDLVRIPNLSSESAGWWRRRLVEWLLDLPAAPSPQGAAAWLIPLYGLLSAAYRVLVTASMVLSVCLMTAGRQLAPLGILLGVTVLVGWMAVPVTAAYRIVSDPRLRRLVVGRRLTALGLAWLLVGAVVGLWPLPRTIQAPALLGPAGAEQVYIPASGRVTTALPSGTLVKPGDVIFALRDLPTELKHQELEARWTILRRRLAAARVRRVAEPELSLALPALENSVVGVREELELAREELDKLTVRATSAGRLLDPPLKPEIHAAHLLQGQLPERRGSPLDPDNTGCLLNRGELGCLVSTGEMQLEVLVHHADVGLARVGQTVVFRTRSRSGGTVQGVVTDIGRTPVTEIPEELLALEAIPMRADASGRPVPREPHYVIRVTLDSFPDQYLTGMTGQAFVSVDRASLWIRLNTWFWRNLRF